MDFYRKPGRGAGRVNDSVKEKSWKRPFGRILGKRKTQIGLLACITALALSGALWSIEEARQELEYSTQEYCREITGQMRDAVDAGIGAKLVSLVNMADSISRVFDHNDLGPLEEFLTRKAGILDFDALFLIGGPEEEMLQVMEGDLEVDTDWLRQQFTGSKLYREEVQMGFLEGQTLFYTAPVLIEGAETHVLVGLRSKETMQGIITSSAFQGNTLSCIIDRQGGVVLSPTELKPFQDLDSIFQSDRQGKPVQALEKIQTDMAKGSAGTVRFTSITGRENLLAYHPLEINDWFLLTIVPVNLMAGDISGYFLRTFLIVMGVALVFLLLLLMLYRIYSDNQKELTRLAYEDSVTGGMNDAAFRQRYQREVLEQGEGGKAIALLNVRNFKLFNEKQGFSMGNEMLRMMNQSIEGQLDKGEFVARGEMDHFFLCLNETDAEGLQARVHGLQETVSRWVNQFYPGQQITFASGCCLAEQPEEDIRVLMDRARIAARDEAAVTRGRCVFYNDSIARQVKREQELDAQFSRALARGDFQVYLQPKVALESGGLRGAEALVRWNHPELGLISPADFVPLFERNGKICQLDFYVFEQVCAFYRRRTAAGKPWYPVSVNLSRHHFYEEDFLEKFHATAQACGLAPRAIEFELTESMFFDRAHNERIKRGIARMHQMGFCCSMDDFGAGYSSLGTLKEFDVDTLKMDRTFFLDMSSEKARDIVRSVVELAAKLDMETVAEGIEREEQLDFLRAIRCDMVQGYVFSRPLPMEEFEDWARRYEAESAVGEGK